MIQKRRKSEQREKIYKIIKNSRSHPTAQDVCKELTRSHAVVSLGNVYRNLRILVEEKRIQLRDFGDGILHYDAILEQHYHFICTACSDVSDFEMPIQTIIERKAGEYTGNLITGHTVQLFGLCSRCRKHS